VQKRPIRGYESILGTRENPVKYLRLCRLHFRIEGLWPPCVIGQAIFVLWILLLLFFFSSPNLSRRKLDVYRTSTRGVALV